MENKREQIDAVEDLLFEMHCILIDNLIECVLDYCQNEDKCDSCVQMEMIDELTRSVMTIVRLI